MSLNLPFMGAAASATTAAPAPARSNDTASSGAGSFGEALSRATQASPEDAATPPAKAAAGTPAKRAGAGQNTETDEALEAVDPVLIPGLAMMALESRPAPLALPGGAPGLAMAGAAQDGAAPVPLAPSLASTALATDETIGLPAAGLETKAPEATATALALATADPRQRGQLAATTGLKTGPATDTPAGESDTADIALASGGRDRPASAQLASDQLPPRVAASPVLTQFDGGPGTAVSTASAQGAARQAAGAAPAAGEAAALTRADAPGLPVSSADASAPDMPVPSLVAQATQGPAGTGSSPAPLPLATPSLPQDVGSSEWGKALGQQLLQMGKAGQEVAELQLHPPGLGPLKVTLSMNEHQLQAAFVSTHSSVRAAVEAALPQLRAALADSGISLGNTSVGADSRQPADANQGQGAHSGQRNPTGASVSRDLAAASERPVAALRSQPTGAGVDLYA